MGLRTVVMLYGILNAATYCCLLPLWEGFDEAYHYGYVQFLSGSLQLPVLGRATLSREVWRSFELVPVSHYVQSFTRAPVNFTEYFTFSREERLERRRRLASIPAIEKHEPQPDKPNYEVNQSPAPYLFMAAIDRALSGQPLPARVLALRLISSILAMLLIADAAGRLARELGLGPALGTAVLFCVFSSQMLFATLCRVSNDTFAVPAMAYLLLAAIHAQRRGKSRDWLALGLALSMALLVKAYFLFLAPLMLFLIGGALWRRSATLAACGESTLERHPSPAANLRRWQASETKEVPSTANLQPGWRCLRAHFRHGRLADAAWLGVPLVVLAVPWYARNVALYHNLTATVEQTSGLGIAQAWRAALAVPWRESIRYMAHTSLWTGNNSFTTFSAATLDLLLLAQGAAIVLYILHAKRTAAEGIIVSAVILFACGLALITIAFYAGSRGGAIAAVPWYMQVLLLPVVLIAFLGLARAPAWGRVVGPVLAALWAYVMAATYAAKLVPWYGGLAPSHVHLAPLWNWYWRDAERRDAMLETVCLGNLAVLKTLLAITLALNVALCAVIVARTAFPRRALHGDDGCVG